MGVDFKEHRFRQELNALPKFTVQGKPDARVRAANPPAWVAVFNGLCALTHASGYRLPSFEQFFRTCERTWCSERNRQREKFLPLFQEDRIEGTRHRLSNLYESGMADAYLYACLVWAIEDNEPHEGIVLYDARADWKLKADTIVLIREHQFQVDAFWGDVNSRPEVEARRDRVERDQKANASDSAHWDNRHLRRLIRFPITRNDTNCQVVNGVRLFTLEAVDTLLGRIYDTAGIENGFFYTPNRRG